MSVSSNLCLVSTLKFNGMQVLRTQNKKTHIHSQWYLALHSAPPGPCVCLHLCSLHYFYSPTGALCEISVFGHKGMTDGPKCFVYCQTDLTMRRWVRPSFLYLRTECIWIHIDFHGELVIARIVLSGDGALGRECLAAQAETDQGHVPNTAK